MGMSRRMYTTHPPHSVATWLFTLRYLILGGSSAQFARQGLLFGTMGQGILSVWAYTACYHAPSKYISGMYGWAHTLINGLYINFSILTSAMITQAVKRGGVNRNISRLFSYQRLEDLSVLRTFRRDRHPWRSPMKSAVETTPQHCLEWLAGWFGFQMEFPFFLFDVVGFWLQKKYVLTYIQ